MKLLILSSAFGDGHNTAAQNVKEAIEVMSPDGTDIRIHDIFKESYGPIFHAVQSTYQTAINRAPSMWSWSFQLLDHTPVLQSQMGIYRRAIKKLTEIIEEFAPDRVLSTHPGCSHLLDQIYRKRLKRPFQTYTLILDSLTINSAWLTATTDRFLVPNLETGSVLSTKGVPASKVTTTGFPVPRTFTELQPKRVPAPSGNERWKVLYMINFQRSKAPDIIKNLLASPRLEVTVTVGDNAKLGARLAGLARKLRKPLHIVGWTPEMPKLMTSHHVLISKAGGAATQEALAAGLPIVFAHVVPGQEEGNARWAVNHGAALQSRSSREVPGLVNKIASHEFWLRFHANAERLGTPAAADRIAEILLKAE